MKTLFKIIMAATLLACSFGASAQVKSYTFWEPQEGAVAATISSNYEVGTTVKFRVPGRIMGVRFYKDISNTGTHIGRVWSLAGGLIASGTFTGETASGWQTMLFTAPPTVLADTQYVVTYNWNTGTHWTGVSGYFTAGGVCNGPVCAIQGRFRTPQALFPTTTSNDAYFADPIFEPSGATGINYNAQIQHVAGYTTRTDNNNFELGWEFNTSIVGSLTAIRMFKLAGAAATHQVSLWDKTTGVLLATRFAPVEQASGWVTVDLDVPIILEPGKTYIVSWHRTGVEPFISRSQTYPIVSGPLTVTGAYHINSAAIAMPNVSSGNNWYGVDVVFTPAFSGIFQ